MKKNRKQKIKKQKIKLINIVVKNFILPDKLEKNYFSLISKKGKHYVVVLPISFEQFIVQSVQIVQREKILSSRKKIIVPNINVKISDFKREKK